MDHQNIFAIVERTRGECDGTEKHNERQTARRSETPLFVYRQILVARNPKGVTYLGSELSQPFRFLGRCIPSRCNLDLGCVAVKRLGSRPESHGQLVQLSQRIRASAVTTNAADLPLFWGEKWTAAHENVPTQTRQQLSLSENLSKSSSTSHRTRRISHRAKFLFGMEFSIQVPRKNGKIAAKGRQL